jgi:phenol 2-monooxygenase
MELLDQVDVWEHMAEIAHISRGYVNYNGGKRVISGTYHSIFNQLHGTFFDYVVNIRQKYSEGIFRRALEEKGGKFYEQYELLSIVQDDAAADDYALTVRVKNTASGEEHQVKWQVAMLPWRVIKLIFVFTANTSLVLMEKIPLFVSSPKFRS